MLAIPAHDRPRLYGTAILGKAAAMAQEPTLPKHARPTDWVFSYRATFIGTSSGWIRLVAGALVPLWDCFVCCANPRENPPTRSKYASKEAAAAPAPG